MAMACSGKVERADPNPTPMGMKEGEGLFSGKSGNLLDAFRSGGGDAQAGGAVGIGVNPFLWRATLDTVSFMPITQADSAGGVIITDWYQNPENAQERSKVNVYILGQQLTPQNLRVTLFQQNQRNGLWQDTAVGEDAVRELENIILTKARRLRIQSNAAR